MPRRGVAVGTIALVLLFLAHARHYDGILYDDPFISYRYARSLAEGDGLVFNRGERVEGYSNFLHVVALAAAARAGIEPPVAGPLMTHAAALAVMLFLAVAAARGALDRRVALLALLLLAASPAWAFWPPRGLETSSHAALVFFGVWLAGRALAARGEAPAARRWLGAWAFLAAAGMMRIEGPLFGVVVGAAGGVAWLVRRRRGAPRAGARGFATGALLFAAVLAAYHAARIAWFGDMLPNTYHAKATGPLLERWALGTRYLATTLGVDLAAPSLLLALGAAAAAWRGLRARATGAPPAPAAAGALPPAMIGLGAAAIGAQAFFAWWVGGDWMGYARFLMPVVPLLALLAADAFVRLLPSAGAPCEPGTGAARRRDALLTLAALAAAGGLAWGVVRSEPMMRALRGGHLAEPIAALGQWLRDDAARRHRGADPATITVAAEEMGLIPWHSRLRCLDMYGLVTREIARRPGGLHAKHDAAWILGRRPEYVVVLAVAQEGPPDPARLVGVFPASQEMLAQPVFLRDYELRRRQPRGTPLFGRLDMCVFARRADAPR